ncbi:hypothetical protein MY10362_009100 [Beauveria mimosiformis]
MRSAKYRSSRPALQPLSPRREPPDTRRPMLSSSAKPRIAEVRQRPHDERRGGRFQRVNGLAVPIRAVAEGRAPRDGSAMPRWSMAMEAMRSPRKQVRASPPPPPPQPGSACCCCCSRCRWQPLGGPIL